MATKKKSTFIDTERNTIITLANAYLESPENTQEQKEEMFWNINFLLTEHNAYRGYNWIQWAKRGGASRYFADYPGHGSTAEDYRIRGQKEYMGLEWDRFFY